MGDHAAVLYLAAWLTAWIVIVFAFCRASPLLWNSDAAGRKDRRTFLVLAAAGLGVVMSCAPLMFLGQSLLAPNIGPTPFFYDSCPTVVGQTDCRPEPRPGADTGAMDWYFFPVTLAGERAIRDHGEFPLWNRYNSAGVSIIGQGQAMLGDPLTWLQWTIGVDAWSFDAKFVLLRLVFAAAIGLAVLTVTGAAGPSMVTAFAASFIGYFGYRVNHTEIFTICYAPLISLCWLKIVHDGPPGRRLLWVAGLFAANWLVLNSGTAKEACMAIAILNAAGFLHFALSGRARRDEAFLPLLAAVCISGLCFVAIALPFFGIFLESLGKSVTAYDIPAVEQFALSHVIVFVEPLFGLLATGRYTVSSNALLLVGCLSALLSLREPGLRAFRGAALSQSLAAAICFALAFSVVPQSFILAVPFVRQIIHLQSTFGAIMIIPTSILAGIGFHALSLRMRSGRSQALILTISAVLVLACLVYVWALPARAPQLVFTSILLMVLVLGSGLAAAWLLASMPMGQPTLPRALVCSLLLLFTLGKNACFPPLAPQGSDLLFEPGQRTSLTVPPAIASRLQEKVLRDPARVIGLEQSFVPGYNAALALETISGPDAVRIRAYAQLCDALALPYIWQWRLLFSAADLARTAGALDFLGVRYVFSAEPLAPLREIENDGRVSLYERQTAWPRAFFTDRIESYADVQGLARRIVTEPSRPFVAVAQNDAEAIAATAPFRVAAAAPAHIVAATDYRLTANTTHFTVDAPSPGVVYLGEADAPGDFIATLNGKEAPIISANHAFKALVINEPGTYRVTFTYLPAHLKLYLTVASLGALTWMISMILFWLSFWRRNKLLLRGATGSAVHGTHCGRPREMDG